jgi:hypothetical protein
MGLAAVRGLDYWSIVGFGLVVVWQDYLVSHPEACIESLCGSLLKKARHSHSRCTNPGDRTTGFGANDNSY